MSSILIEKLLFEYKRNSNESIQVFIECLIKDYVRDLEYEVEYWKEKYE